MANPVAITEVVPAASDAMPVIHDEDAGIVAELTEDASVVLSDGRTRHGPIPVVIVDAGLWENAAGQMIGAVPMNISNLVEEP